MVKWLFPLYKTFDSLIIKPWEKKINKSLTQGNSVLTFWY